MRNITDLMNTYRECSRNLWNVYFSKQTDIGLALDLFGQIRELLFESLILTDVKTDSEGENVPLSGFMVVPRANVPILIQRVSAPGEAGYWDQEKDLMVGPNSIVLAFLDYFDFSQVPIKELRYYLCRIVRFPSHAQYEGRQALLEVSDAHVFHDEQRDLNGA